MASIILPHEWRIQPQSPIELNGQIADAVAFATVPGLPWRYDLKRKILPVTTGTINPQQTPKGMASVPTSASSTRYSWTGIKPINAMGDGYAMLVLAAPIASETINRAFYLGDEAASNYTGSLLAFNCDYHASSSSGLFALVEYSGGFKASIQSFSSAVDGNWHVFIANRPAGNSQPSVFVDGNDRSSIVGSADSGVNFTTGVHLHGVPTSTTQGCADPIALAVAFNRPLTLSEIKTYSENPWQIFAPIQRKIWIPSTGGGATTGTGALTTSEATLSGSGALGHTGTGSLTTSEATLSGTGSVTHTGTGSLTTSEATLSGTGALTHAGTGDLTTTEATSSGSGVVGHTGTGALTITAVQASGSGTVGTGGFTGTGSLTTTDVTVSGSGTVGHTGTGSPTVDPTEVSGTGNVTHTGTGDLTINVVTVSGYDQLVTPSVTGGGIGHGGKRKKRTRTIVVEVNGQEYRVAEENLESFLEINRVKQPEAPVKVEKSKTSKKVKLAPIEKAEPKIEGEFADEQASRTNEFLAQMVEQAFVEYMRRQEDVAFARYLQQMDDEDDELLMMMLT